MYRAEHLIEDTLRERQTKGTLSAQQLSRWIAMGERVPDGSAAELQRLIDEFNIMSPEGNALSAPREYNLMFSTRLGADKGMCMSPCLYAYDVCVCTCSFTLLSFFPRSS